MFMISLYREYYQFFLAQGFLLGIGQALLTCPILTMISAHFNKNRGLATGITIAGSSLGGVIWPIMVNQLLNKDGVTFGWTMRIISFTMMPLVAIACLTVRRPATKAVGTKETATLSSTQKPKKKKADMPIVRKREFQIFVAESDYSS